MPSVRGLAFDAYGTLFDVHSVIKACRRVTPEAEAFSREWRAKQVEYTWLRALMGRYEDFWRVTETALTFALKRFGLQVGPAQKAALMEAYLSLAPFPEVPAALERLKGLPLIILSNGSPRMLEAVAEASGLRPYFRAIVSVDAIRTYKPSPRVYELATPALGLPREEIGFVSSNGWDAIGAKAYGFQVFWINRGAAPLDELGVVPDREIRGLDELAGLLGH